MSLSVIVETLSWKAPVSKEQWIRWYLNMHRAYTSVSRAFLHSKACYQFWLASLWDLSLKQCFSLTPLSLSHQQRFEDHSNQTNPGRPITHTQGCYTAIANPFCPSTPYTSPNSLFTPEHTHPHTLNTFKSSLQIWVGVLISFIGLFLKVTNLPSFISLDSCHSNNTKVIALIREHTTRSKYTVNAQ